jgi:hypothetical protein
LGERQGLFVGVELLMVEVNLHREMKVQIAGKIKIMIPRMTTDSSRASVHLVILILIFLLILVSGRRVKIMIKSKIKREKKKGVRRDALDSNDVLLD